MLVACENSRANTLVTVAIFYIAAKHQDIMGTFKLPEEMTDAHIDFILDSGRRAFNVRHLFFPSQETLSLPVRVGAGGWRIAQRYIFNCNAQLVELANQFAKESAHQSN